MPRAADGLLSRVLPVSVPPQVSLPGVVSLGSMVEPIGGHLLLLAMLADLDDVEDGWRVLLVAVGSLPGNNLPTGLGLVSLCLLCGLFGFFLLWH